MGTDAEIWLPVAHGSDAAEESPTASAGGLPAVLSAMLEDLGHNVIEATSAQRALRHLEMTDAIDLVITDHAMPGITGMQLIATIR